MPWITLQDAKKQLNKSPNNTGDDAELQGFIDAACAIVEDLKGHVDPVEFTETHDALNADSNARGGGSWFIEPNEIPVLEVVSVLASDGTALTPDAVTVDNDLIRVPGADTYTVTYVAGVDFPPSNYRLAALELVTHLWRSSQLNQNSGRPQIGGDQMMVLPGAASALPYRVRELLGVYGEVVPSRPVIA